MGTSRRVRRAHGRVAGGSAGGKKGAVTKASRAGARRAGKAALLSAARDRRKADGLAPSRLLALIPVSGGSGDALAAASSALRGAKASTVLSFLDITRAGGSERDWTIAALDAAKVADVLVFVFGEEPIDDAALTLFAALRAQGLPEVISVAVGGSATDALARRRRGRELAAESLGADAALRPFDVSTPEGISRTLRKCCGGSVKALAWRKRYGYMHVEEAAVVQPGDGGKVSLALSGVVRGAGLSANQLMMITGVGAFKVERIVGRNSEPPCCYPVLGVRCEEDGEPVESEAPDDGLGGEQTWPPEVGDLDMNEAPRPKARVPDGVSDYQAAWLPGHGPGEGKDEEGKDADAEDESDGDDDADDEEMDGGEGEDEDMEIDMEEVERARAEAAARTDAEFPDEVDTPMDTAARVRFARYRGLKSFRASEWDPKEQLPRPYARLFQFADLASTRKQVLTAVEASASAGSVDAKAGVPVIITLTDVPQDVATNIVAVVAGGRTPVVLSGMLKHENRRSVVHFGLQRVDGEEGGVIKAKTPLEMHCGFARFLGRPMFSEQNANCDKHKMERYLVHGRHTVASFYGPAVYAPAPALMFKPGGDLVATGSALGADPDRIILKRIVLTGYPFKTQKKRTVVKFMFFQPDDVRWFRPVELWTKLGRTGHIVEPLGTHGRMKCIFDASVLHHDTVCLTLYKRVFPKTVEDAQK